MPHLETEAVSARPQGLSRHPPGRGLGQGPPCWIRQRLLPTLIQRRAPRQIRGLPSQQTVTAIQLLKLHGRQGRHHRITTAVIFVDLRAAFHHMLRGYVFTARRPLTRQTLQRIFDPTEFDIERLACDLHQACQDSPGDIPAAMRAFLHDVHKSTWFQMHSFDDTVVTTDRGTHPGPPLLTWGSTFL